MNYIFKYYLSATYHIYTNPLLLRFILLIILCILSGVITTPIALLESEDDNSEISPNDSWWSRNKIKVILGLAVVITIIVIVCTQSEPIPHSTNPVPHNNEALPNDIPLKPAKEETTPPHSDTEQIDSEPTSEVSALVSRLLDDDRINIDFNPSLNSYKKIFMDALEAGVNLKDEDAIDMACHELALHYAENTQGLTKSYTVSCINILQTAHTIALDNDVDLESDNLYPDAHFRSLSSKNAYYQEIADLYVAYSATLINGMLELRQGQ